MLELSAGCRLAGITDPLTLISVVSYNTSLKKRIHVAGPRYTRPSQFLRHQGLLENWQQYILAEGVQLNELGLTMYYRSLRRAVIIYSSHNIVGKFTP